MRTFLLCNKISDVLNDHIQQHYQIYHGVDKNNLFFFFFFVVAIFLQMTKEVLLWAIVSDVNVFCWGAEIGKFVNFFITIHWVVHFRLKIGQ